MQMPSCRFSFLTLGAEAHLRSSFPPSSFVLHPFFLLLPLILFSLSCGSTTETITGPSPERCGVQARVESSTFTAAGGSGTLQVTTARECTWSAESSASWLRLSSPTQGQGESALQFTVAPNADPPQRTASITVKDQQVQISQTGRPCEFQLSSTHESLEPAGGERTIEIAASSAQCAWTGSTDVSWITIVNGREGTGNGALVFRVGAATGPHRTGTISVAGRSVLVEQGTGCTTSVSPLNVTIGPQGGDGSVQVVSGPGCEWTAAANASWIRVNAGARGSGVGRVEFTVAANAGIERTGTVAVGGRTITVFQQDGCTFALDRDQQTFPSAGGSGTAVVSAAAGCGWSSTSAAPWITISGAASGSGNGQVQFTVAAYTGPARDGVLTVRGARLTIAQASGCTYSAAATGQSLSSGGGSGTVAVTTGAGCPWNATTNAEWIHLSPASGTGPEQVRFTATANSGPPRSTTLIVAGQSFTLTQASACTYLLAPPSHLFDAGGGNGTILVIVTGPCTWTASSAVDWIRITNGSSGAGNGLVQFVVSANSGPTRIGTLLIAGQEYQVTQRGR